MCEMSVHVNKLVHPYNDTFFCVWIRHLTVENVSNRFVNGC